MPTAAVVLSGCGFLDGSEIHETVAVLLALSRAGATTHCFAPDGKAPTVNHLTGQPDGTSRNILVEAARIARGEIKPLAECFANDFDAVFFPGGFGAAKNLSTFATDGAKCTVDPQAERVLKEFGQADKPVGFCCIAPVLAAKVFSEGVTITLGPQSDASKAAQQMGATHVEAPANQAVVDASRHIVTAPAYMCDAPLHEVADGIAEMVNQTLALIPRTANA